MNKCDYCINDCRCTSSQRRACIESDYQSFQMFEEPKEIRLDNRWAVLQMTQFSRHSESKERRLLNEKAYQKG